ncbi:unnamed protein product [Schistosoma mattheei]|uniref:Uncharacterized protein n=1 Tax=Schistosoma mattheei TaxID=31246 RepID=A0A183P5D7_9TREM|nr:unnamed protein product [Schistosoma mattheei]
MENLTYLVSIIDKIRGSDAHVKSLNKHKMEPFVQVFFAIDKDGTETITIDELKKYVADNNLDEMMVTAKRKEKKNKTSMDTEHSGILA